MKKSAAKVTGDADLAAWCAALTAEVITEEVPPGWHTCADLATQLKKPRSTMSKLLLLAVRAGKCDRQEFRTQVGSLVRPTWHYRLK